MGLFSANYKITEGEKAERDKPFVQARLQRAFAAAIDNAKVEKLDQQENFNSLVQTVANGDVEAVRSLAMAKAEIQFTQEVVDILEDLNKKFFDGEPIAKVE